MIIKKSCRPYNFVRGLNNSFKIFINIKRKEEGIEFKNREINHSFILALKPHKWQWRIINYS